MAKGDVVMKFDADTAASVQKLLALRQEMMKTADTTRDVGKSAVKTGEDFSGMATKMTQVITSAVGIGSVMGTVSAAWNSQVEEMARRAGVFKESVKSLQETLAGIGRVDQLPQMREWLGTLAQNNSMDRSTVTGMFGKIAGTLGEKASDGDLKAAMQAAIGGILAGNSPDRAAQIGTTFGEFASDGIFRRTAFNENQQQEVAGLFSREIPEGLSDKEIRYIQRAKDPVAAMNQVLAAHRGHEKKEIDSLSADAETLDPAEVRKLHSDHTPDAKRKLRLQAIPEDERIDAMLSDPSLVAPEHRRAVANIKAQSANRIQDSIQNHPLLNQQLAFQKLKATDPTTIQSARADLLKAQQDLIDKKRNLESITDANVWQQKDLDLQGQGRENSWGRNTILGIEEFGHWSGIDQLPRQTIGRFGVNTGPTNYEKARGELEASASEQLKQTNEHLQEISRHLAEINTRTQGNPAFSNNSAGQK